MKANIIHKKKTNNKMQREDIQNFDQKPYKISNLENCELDASSLFIFSQVILIGSHRTIRNGKKGSIPFEQAEIDAMRNEHFTGIC